MNRLKKLVKLLFLVSLILALLQILRISQERSDDGHRNSVPYSSFSDHVYITTPQPRESVQSASSPVARRGATTGIVGSRVEVEGSPLLNTTHQHRKRYLSYQSPGNGWNNQRQALENAIVLAKLLNRTLVVQPMSPHDKVRDIKHGGMPGFIAYNQLKQEDLMPLSRFLDMQKLGQIVPYKENQKADEDFKKEHQHLSWRYVCHSVGFGYWVDRRPHTPEEEELLRNQRYRLKQLWQKKCPREQYQFTEANPGEVIIEYIEDLLSYKEEMLYFEQGTLYGITLRFFDYDRARKAQHWVNSGIHYSASVKAVGDKIVEIMGGRYNAIHVRRTDHYDHNFEVEFWIESLRNASITPKLPLYVATDEEDLRYFLPMKQAGYRLYFYTDLLFLYNFTGVPSASHKDFIGMHEQYICWSAEAFIPSPHSTFSFYILRKRESSVIWKQGLIDKYILALWIPNHTHSNASHMMVT